MDQSDMESENMALVSVTHVVDAITFWAQNVSEDQANENMSIALADKCPKSPKVFGIPRPQQMYGAVFSEDGCWYRCKVQHQTDDKFHVCYVDYGNTEYVSRSELVELPEDLQSPCLAKRFQFWGSHIIYSDEDSQGKAFLQNLIVGKRVRVQRMSVGFNGTILVKAFQGDWDIGDDVMKMKFASRLSPLNRESHVFAQPFHNPSCLAFEWVQERGPQEKERGPQEKERGPQEKERGPQGDGPMVALPMCMPKLYPALPDQRPQSVKEGNPWNARSDSLTRSISVVINNSTSAPVAMEKVDVAWENHRIAQEKLNACQTKEQLVDLINDRNLSRNALTATVDAFLQEAKCLAVGQRVDKLEEVRASLTAVFGPASVEGVVEGVVDDAVDDAFEQFYQWKALRDLARRLPMAPGLSIYDFFSCYD